MPGTTSGVSRNLAKRRFHESPTIDTEAFDIEALMSLSKVELQAMVPDVKGNKPDLVAAIMEDL